MTADTIMAGIGVAASILAAWVLLWVFSYPHV